MMPVRAFWWRFALCECFLLAIIVVVVNLLLSYRIASRLLRDCSLLFVFYTRQKNWIIKQLLTSCWWQSWCEIKELLVHLMQVSYADCCEIVAACKSAGVILAVCHVLRYTPQACKIDELIQSGCIGDVINIQHIEPVSSVNNYQLTWCYWYVVSVHSVCHLLKASATSSIATNCLLLPVM